MAQPNHKILGYSLLALTTVLALSKKKTPGIGRPSVEQASSKRKKRIERAYDELKCFFGNKYQDNREKETGDSTYYMFRAGNVDIKIRNGDHSSWRQPNKSAVTIDLFQMTTENDKETAKEVYDKTKKLIRELIKAGNL